VTYVIAQPCVDVLDRACIEECPVDCIYEGERMLYIHPDECVDCGACEPVCPVEAIYYEDDVPDQWKDYYKVNVDFFEDLGSPGGASKTAFAVLPFRREIRAPKSWASGFSRRRTPGPFLFAALSSSSSRGSANGSGTRKMQLVGRFREAQVPHAFGRVWHRP